MVISTLSQYVQYFLQGMQFDKRVESKVTIDYMLFLYRKLRLVSLLEKKR